MSLPKIDILSQSFATPMLVTDVGDEICLREVWSISDRFLQILSLTSFIFLDKNIERSPTLRFCPQDLRIKKK